MGWGVKLKTAPEAGRPSPHVLPSPGQWSLGQKVARVGRWGPPGVLPVPRVDPAGGAARVVYVVDLAVEVARLLPALRQGKLRPGHLPKRGPRSPMQLPAATGAPGSEAEAGCTQPGRQPRHHNVGGGGRPWTGGPSERRPRWRACPCGPAAPQPRPGAARSSRRSRCHVRPQPRGAGPGARRAGGTERAERRRRLPSSAAPRAAPSTPPPPPPLPPLSRVPSFLSAPPGCARSLARSLGVLCLRQVRPGRCR